MLQLFILDLKKMVHCWSYVKGPENILHGYEDQQYLISISKDSFLDAPLPYTSTVTF